MPLREEIGQGSDYFNWESDPIFRYLENRMKKPLPLLLCLLACLLLPLPTLAEEAKNEEDTLQLEPVVVTSQKVKADKQDVPASVTAYTEMQLKDLNMETLEDVATFSPNIGFNKMDGYTTQFSYRGIGGLSNMNKVWNISIDDVFVPYVALDTQLDVGQIEVVRGSQGSLYGRNTHAGLVNITTKPVSQETTAEASVDYSRYNTLNASGVLGSALTDSSAFRMAFSYKRSDGYFENTFLDEDDSNNSEQFTGRGKLEWKPAEAGTFTFSMYADSYNSGFDQCGPIDKSVTTKTENNEPGYNKGFLVSPTLHWEKDFGGFKMTSITNYSRSHYGFLHDWDFSSLDIQQCEYGEDFNTITQEIRFNGGDMKGLKWLAGVFGLYENIDTSTEISFGNNAGLWGMTSGDTVRQDSTVQTAGLAVFGELSHRFFDRIEVTGTLRIDYEHKDLDWENSTNIAWLDTGEVDLSKHWIAASPSFSVAYLFDEQKRIYASVARGFKAGDYNNVMSEVSLVQEAVDPEFTTTYEIGYKGRHYDNRLECNAALFYIQWDDMQVDTYSPSSPFGNYEKRNAAEAHSSGLELDARFRVMHGWDIFASGGYMFEYEFDDFQFNTTTNLKGKKLPFTNQYTVSCGTTYRFDSGYYLGMNASRRGEQYLVENNNYKQSAYTLLNAKVGYESEGWDVYLYGNNLLDEDYAVSCFNGALLSGEPISFGTKFTVRF